MEYGTEVDIDRRKCRRLVPMKVLALGCGRTGTNSLYKALQILGYSETYHMEKCSGAYPRDCDLWLQAFRSKYLGVGTFGLEEWDQLLGHCMAVTDFPAACFASELVEAYPDAKVILTTRDADEWYNSVLSTINWRVNDRFLYWLSFVDWGYRWYAPMIYTLWDEFFEGDFEKNGKAAFLQHNARVRKLVPAQQLMEYDVKQGWRPLCDFLQVDVPGQPFPSGNDKDSFRESCRSKDMSKARKFLGKVAIGGVVLGICVKLWQRAR